MSLNQILGLVFSPTVISIPKSAFAGLSEDELQLLKDLPFEENVGKIPFIKFNIHSVKVSIALFEFGYR
tara:strand:+ start:7965 stop:8171 length:207 start_codon:yes stop_codon:yes gene_type:complete